MSDRKSVKIPTDLAVDMAILLQQFCEMFNTNDAVLEANGIDWWYMHKLNRRVQYQLNNGKTGIDILSYCKEAVSQCENAIKEYDEDEIEDLEMDEQESYFQNLGMIEAYSNIIKKIEGD